MRKFALNVSPFAGNHSFYGAKRIPPPKEWHFWHVSSQAKIHFVQKCDFLKTRQDLRDSISKSTLGTAKSTQTHTKLNPNKTDV